MPQILNELEDDDDDDDHVLGPGFMEIRTGFLDAKRTAIMALGMIAEYSGPQFAQGGHLQKALPAVVEQIDYWNAKIRREVAEACGKMVVAAAVGHFGPDFKEWSEDVSWGEGVEWPAAGTEQTLGLLGYVCEIACKVRRGFFSLSRSLASLSD